MSRILLVEPSYRSTYPPLGLMRISMYHKQKGDTVVFTRGMNREYVNKSWHRVYVSSLFTYELPRTVKTIQYYSDCVSSPNNLVVGGIGATLVPDYILKQVDCKLIKGPLNRGNMLGIGSPAVGNLPPDYNIIKDYETNYCLTDAYFSRTTMGCIRNCRFCAVPKLEPNFGVYSKWRNHIDQIRKRFGERQHLILLDNNFLAKDDLKQTIESIQDEGFYRGAKLCNKLRRVDFTQGLDARLISPRAAKLLGKINLNPIRLAFDSVGMEKSYRIAINRLNNEGYSSFTNYMLYNFNDNPISFYHRMKINIEIALKNNVRITAFPMRYIPTNAIQRGYVGKNWTWRYLRGIQCILVGTRGIVSPNPDYFFVAFGNNSKEFIEIISMPDDYIIHRMKHKNHGARRWLKKFRAFSPQERKELMLLLEKLHFSRNRKSMLCGIKKYKSILRHYYSIET